MMSLETAIQKIKQLSPKQQEQVFQLVDTLEKDTKENENFFAIAGIWEDREINAKTLRKEAWKEQNK